jgi:hypothetical protein
MTLFTFHTFRADGAPVALESVDLPSSERAIVHAHAVLAAHRSAQSVTVCQDDQEIASIARAQD